MDKKLLALVAGTLFGVAFFSHGVHASGNVTVSLDPLTPPARSVVSGAGSASAPFVKFTLTASSNEDIWINSITVTRSGISSDGDVQNIALYDDSGTRIGFVVAMLSGGKATFSFPTITIPANSTKAFLVYAEVSTSAISGKTIILGVTSASDISAVGKTSSETIFPTGSFPVNGYPVTISSPDLIISDFSWTPLNPTVSQADPYIAYSFTVKNIGGASVIVPTNTEFAVYKNSVSTSNKAGAVVIGSGVFTLAPQESKVFSNHYTMQSPNIRAQAGTFDLIMMADAGNIIQEANESNNTLTRSITIGTSSSTTATTTPSITVLSPNGGEQFQAGQAAQMPLQWNASCSLASFSISLYKAGVFVQTMVNNIAAGICSASQTSLPYYTTWPISSTLQAGSDYKIRVSSGSVSDDSNASFSITAVAPTPTPTPPPVVATSTITILSPNGGEILSTKTPYTITWSSSGVESVVFYVTDTQDRVLVTNISGTLT